MRRTAVDEPPAAGRGRAYLELLRPANVATALADVLAGAAVAGVAPSVKLASLLAASACLYAGGVVLNDYFDRDLDARERPERPIPSGRVPAVGAGWLGAGLLLGGVGAAATAGPSPAAMAAAVALTVLVYDAWAKHHPLVGPVNMGLCRALNLLLGLSVGPTALAESWPVGLLPLVYIAAVTVVSRGEVHGSKRAVAWLAFGLVVSVAAALGLMAWASHREAPNATHLDAGRAWTLALVVWLASRVVPPFWRVCQTPSPPVVRTAVRTGVLSLVLVDGVIAASYAGIIESLAVLAIGVLAWWLARLFAVT